MAYLEVLKAEGAADVVKALEAKRKALNIPDASADTLKQGFSAQARCLPATRRSL
jgi:hypothetical protein